MKLTKPQIEMLRRLANGETIRRLHPSQRAVQWQRSYRRANWMTFVTIRNKEFLQEYQEPPVDGCKDLFYIISDAGRAALAEWEQSQCG